MRNKPFSYQLSGWLLLAGLTVALPSRATDIQGECFSSDVSQCVGSTQSVEVTFKASFITPSCNVMVPSQIILPDVTIADFSPGGRLYGLTPYDLHSSISTQFDVTLSQCDAIVADTSRWKFVRLTFTDLGTTSGEAGIFAADNPPRGDVGFVIQTTDGLNVLLNNSALYANPGTPDTDLIYQFKARMQQYTGYTGTVAPGQVTGSVSVVATYE